MRASTVGWKGFLSVYVCVCVCDVCLNDRYTVSTCVCDVVKVKEDIIRHSYSPLCPSPLYVTPLLFSPLFSCSSLLLFLSSPAPPLSPTVFISLLPSLLSSKPQESFLLVHFSIREQARQSSQLASCNKWFQFANLMKQRLDVGDTASDVL